VAEIEQMHRSNSPASGTPATDGRFVYTAFQKDSELLVSAHDFDGHLVWRQTPGEFESRHGFNTSPVIHDGSLFLSGMQDGPDAFFARLDCLTGQIVWKSAIEDPVRSFSTPFVVRSQSRAQIVLSGANRTLSFDPRNGSRLWSARGPAQKTVSSICRGDGMLFVAGGRDNTLLAIRPDGSGDVTESHVAWRASRGIPYVCSPVFHDGILHVISDDGIYTRYAANDGSIQMRHRLTSAVSSSPVVACRRIYITDEDGRTKVVDAGSEFRVLANNSVGERTFASLAVSGGDILIRGESHLFCVRQSPATARTE